MNETEQNPLSAEPAERQELGRLRAKHLRMIELHAAGMSGSAIAQALGVSQGNVSLVLSSPLAQEELARLRATRTDLEAVTTASAVASARAKLEGLAGKAVAVHDEILSDPLAKPELKLRSADSVLDRVLGKQTDGSAGLSVTINASQLQVLQLALSEARAMRSAPEPKPTPLGIGPVPTDTGSSQ